MKRKRPLSISSNVCNVHGEKRRRREYTCCLGDVQEGGCRDIQGQEGRDGPCVDNERSAVIWFTLQT